MPRQRQTPRKTKSKSRKKVTAEEGWWSIRAIIDERLVNGRVEYLVDWEPDTKTGKSFEPTWSSEITDEAKAEWETRKASNTAPSAAASVASTTTSPNKESQDSQPPRPSNWRHIKRTRRPTPSQGSSPYPETGDDEQPPAKRIRTEFSATLSEDSVPSLASAPSVASAIDIGELDIAVPPYPQHKVYVEIYKDPAFDPSEYQTQSTIQTSSSQSLAELEGEDERIIISSQLSQRTVPDSQEPSGQSWSQDHSQTHPLASEAPLATDPNPPTVRSPIQGSTSQTDTSGSVEDASLPKSNSNIPSRQLVDPDNQSIEAQCLSPPRVEVPVSSLQSSTAGPVYLTQPPLPTASQSYNTISSNPACIEATTSEEQSSQKDSHTNIDQRDSQAAQITRHDSDPVSEEFVLDSTNPDTTPAQRDSLSGREEVSSLFLNEFNNSFHAKSFSAYAENLSSQARSHYGASQGSRIAAMDSSDQPSSSERRVSAVDELKQLCSFDDIINDISQAGNDGQEPPAGSQQTSSELQAPILADAASTMPPASEIEMLSQPLDQGNHWLPDTMSTSQGLGSDSLTSPAILTQPPMDSLPSMDLQTSDSLHGDISSGTLIPGPHDMQQATISPADITRLIVNETATMEGLPHLPQGISPSALDMSGESITMAQLPIRNDEVGSIPSSYSDNSPVEHLITLPFQSRVRPMYDDTILEYRNEIKRFGEIFNTETYTEPDSSLLERIDELLARLQTLCDYPQDFDGTQLANLSPMEQAKYSYDANAKFNFVQELLQLLEKDTNVIIVTKSQEVGRLLFLIAESLEIDCRCEAISRSTNIANSTVRLTIALPSEQNDATGYDIIIAFDPSYAHSHIAQQLVSLPDRKSPHVLMLVTTHAIEHIDMRIPSDLTPLERRSALLSSIVRARKLTSDPDRGYPEPYEIAKLFGEYFNDGGDPVAWEPVPIPDHVLDVYESLQSQPMVPTISSEDQDNGHKRKLDDEDGSDAKRIRTLALKEALPEAYEPVLSPEVRQMLESSSSTTANLSGTKVLVSVSILEALAEQFAGYRHQLDDTDYTSENERVISGLEKQLKEYERTTNQIYEKFRTAIQDRTKFEKDKIKADVALQTSVESARVQGEKFQKRISELEATIARLSATSEAGEAGAQGGLDDVLKEERAKIEALEKKLTNARSQLDFVTNQYQEVRAEATAMKTELTGLKGQNEHLQKTSSENFVRIHQIQADASTKQHLAQIAELKALLREREMELDKTRDELRVFKNGRRETRQVSVPRSPRMGMMSPRTGRGYGGSTSRGTSPAPGSGTDGASTTPVPGMQYLTQQTGNGRWNHLRE